jgi:hypothetical protein
MEVLKAVAYELQPCRPQDVVSFFRWTVRNAQSLYQHIPSRQLAAQALSFVKGVSVRSAVLTLAWAALWLCSIYCFSMGSLFLMLSLLVAMFANFDDRKAHTLSAYSIFNIGCQRILGTMTAEQFEKERVGNHHYHDDDDTDNDFNNVDDELYDDIGGDGDDMQRVSREQKKERKAHKSGKKSRRNYEERKRKKEQYNLMVQQQELLDDGEFYFDD